MIGKTVVKMFGDEVYMGNIVSFDPRHKWYRVHYEDGDSEDLNFRELRVPAWPVIKRDQVLWLDEKHKKIILGLCNRHEWLFTVDPNDPDVFMRIEDGGVYQEPRPCTKGKYMSVCRGIFGVMMY